MPDERDLERSEKFYGHGLRKVSLPSLGKVHSNNSIDIRLEEWKTGCPAESGKEDFKCNRWERLGLACRR